MKVFGIVRDIAADTPARFNADPKRLFEASGSAGEFISFAFDLDTFAKQEGAKVQGGSDGFSFFDPLGRAGS